MTLSLDTLKETARLSACFEAAGALRVETDILQPAEILLDLYGEDIRGRAYVTQDPMRGEQMMRPDFTVPVVQMHMAEGAEPARYTYSGKVFRQQDNDPSRPSEYMQVGYEVFDRSNPAAADAEVFAVIADALADFPVRATTGDIGILKAAVQGLDTIDTRKAALMRHIWRPKRFRKLLDRFAGRTDMSWQRKTLLADLEPLENAKPVIGLRSLDEVAQRITAIHKDAVADEISEKQVQLIEDILKLRETLPNVLSQLQDITVDLPAISDAVDQFAARIEALKARGVDVDGLMFDGAYGLTQMEYYDGFVFGFTPDSGASFPVATGGRYDALTQVLGQGKSIPAMGGVIRPEAVVALKGGAA